MIPNAVSSAATCSLEGRAYQERIRWIAELNQRSLLRSSRQGSVLNLTYALIARSDVEKMVTQEQECCAFLDFSLQVSEAVDLTISVPGHAASRADDLLAPFDGTARLGTDITCCGICESPAFPVQESKAAGAAMLTSATAVLTCGACCVIPLAFPAIAATMAGGLLAGLARAHTWMTGVAVGVVVLAWLWIWRQTVKHKARASNATLGLMGAASLVTLLAIAWSSIEVPLIALILR